MVTERLICPECGRNLFELYSANGYLVIRCAWCFRAWKTDIKQHQHKILKKGYGDIE